MTAVVVHGIPNCDPVKKARAWLDARGVGYAFHDFKKDGVTSALLQRWLADASADALVNRRGTTWRKLTDAQRAAADHDDAGALAAMLTQPSVIKRPVLTIDGRVAAVGFDAERYAALF